MTLRLALVGGPMYDPLYALLDGRDVEIVVHADHPTLNRAVAELLQAGERIDLLSTHSKYAPSQEQWLRPLDDLVDPAIVAALAPGALKLCRFDGRLLSVPRNIDVRVLWVRTDLVRDLPETWADVLATGEAFGFPGRESGLFGTFFELVVAHGGRLFDDELRPTIETPEAVAAVETLVELSSRAPDDLVTWHYDQVDEALRSGRVAMAATWPGGFGPLREAPVYDRLAVVPYPAGPVRRVSYAGVHSWAIPATCSDVDATLDLLRLLTSAEAGALEASHGSVCAHTQAFSATEPVDATDSRRLAITVDTIGSGMITYPPLRRFPEIEDAGWQAINAALRGVLSPLGAVEGVQVAAEEVLAK